MLYFKIGPDLIAWTQKPVELQGYNYQDLFYFKVGPDLME